MRTQNNDQLQFNFEAPVKVRRVVSERNRDSEGRYALDMVSANDLIERIATERDIYRTNYLILAKQLRALNQTPKT